MGLIIGKSIHHSFLSRNLLPLTTMSGVLTPRPILAHIVHPRLLHIRYSRAYSVTRKLSELDINPFMNDIFCSYDFMLAFKLLLESKASNTSWVSFISVEVEYGTTWTGQPLSSNCSNQSSICLIGWNNAAENKSWVVLLAFRSLIRS